jgi:hypothetical protein
MPAEPCFFPEFLPDSDDFLCLSPTRDTGRHHVYLASLRPGEAADGVRLMQTDSAPHYTPAGGGRLLFVRNDNLYWQRLNRASRALEGAPELVLAGVASQPAGSFRADFSVSRSGTIAWRPGTAASTQATTFDRQGTRLGTSGPLGAHVSVVLSPDGTRLLASGGERSWLLDVGQPGRVILPPDVTWFDWSVDGTSVVGIEPGRKLVERDVDASEIRSRDDLPDMANLLRQDLSRDGKTLLSMGVGGRGLFAVDLEHTTTERRVKPLLDEEVPAFDARFSPDDRWIVYATREANPTGTLFVQAFPGPGRRREIAPIGVDPEWRGDGKEIVYLGPDRGVWSVAVERTGDELRFGVPQRLFSPVRIPTTIVGHRQLAVTADGSRFFIAEAVEQPDAVIHVTNTWLTDRR